MATLFISYRRADSEHFSARLHEGLENKLGIGEAFLDVENIQGSENWKQRLQEEVESASLVIVVIGNQWLTEINKRLHSPEEDQVVWEIRTALTLGKPLVPLLVSGAAMPKPEELPESICTFPSSNALALRSTQSEDFQKTLQDITAILAKIQPHLSAERSRGMRRFLDPGIDMFSRYAHQEHLIGVAGSEGKIYQIPAVEVLNANDIPSSAEAQIEFIDTSFETRIGSRAALEEYKRDAKSRGKSFYDDETARLSDVRGGEKITLVFQPTTYFESVKTNMALDFDDGINGCLRDEIHPDGKLEELSESQLGNHMGINGLVFSNDGFMLFQRRSAKVFTNPNLLCPGFSGAIKLTDIKNRRSSIDNLADLDMFREMIEELGIKEKMIARHRFLGLSRELLRGGKPEIFFGVELNMSAAEIQQCLPKEKEGDLFFLETRNDGIYLNEQQTTRLSQRFEQLLKKMETDAGARASLPLLTNLAFWVNQNQPALQLVKNS